MSTNSKSKNPVILSVILHRQNPLESTTYFSLNLNNVKAPLLHAHVAWKCLSMEHMDDHKNKERLWFQLLPSGGGGHQMSGSALKITVCANAYL
jgi:hypothetical protein